ncbi:NAD(P)-dependent oxidoreductase [Lichenifustis flavocetrariae]|uniref:NAD(P)-dependent oxidoreductase n=1 Tax=Lichenifustis flavocetrariae TaxID=2949735 RepID=A0AA41YQU5_9HYPH|nr:NAD(P)-dependent oxidoreductase [Lichenifustis flavocetrariae]MCW6506861.1 NAD(P)-dependent oxidoreductase [Lichenifustis flavocetrariae]
MKVGFIGLGAMGIAMARNLLRAGHEVTVWNRSPEPAQSLAGEGAKVASSPVEVVAAEAVVTMLANDAAVKSVFLDGGALDQMSKTTIHVNCATISVALAQDLTERHRARGLAYVAAPVFGRPDVAAARQLNIVVAGPAQAIETIRPLLDAMGQKTWPVGEEPFQANVVKIGGNLMIASAIEAMAEVASLGVAHGLDPAAMLNIYTSTLFACRAYQSYSGGIAARRYEPAGFKLELGLKDVRLALAAGDATNVSLPFGSALRDAMMSAVAAGDGHKDWSALGDVALRRSGLVSD